MLDIYAGKTALNTIQENGFKQELFTSFLGASGGPKWFTLFGLDKYLFGDFFKGRTQELNIIGSSAGAFRAACFAQNDPINAITQLAKNYAETTYSDKTTATEITAKAIELLDLVFDQDGVRQVLNNQVFKTHFIVAKTKGLTSLENKICQTAGLASSYFLNKIDRKLLRFQYERFVYHSPQSSVEVVDPYQFKTRYVQLTDDNIKQSLLASGSIPLVMSGIKNIHNSPKGMYRDGGIIDYHFDFALKNNKGLTLYPHFTAQPKAGWFDKNSKRKVLNAHYENTVMLVPSQKFIDSLPYKKIPDRTDFTHLDANTRIRYWKTVLAETDRLAENLNSFIENQAIEKIKPIFL